VEVEPVEDVAALAAWRDIDVATRDADHVALPADPLEDRLPVLDPATPEAGVKVLLRLGCVDGRPVAASELRLPTLDNLSAAYVDVRVHPLVRRRGYGRQLLTAGLAEVKELGRTRVFFEVHSPYEGGPALADRLLRAAGARPVLMELRRLLDLHAEPPSTPPEPPAGYRLVQWVNKAPDELVDDLAFLMYRMSTDTPLGEMEWEPEAWDAARYRDKEVAELARGRVRYLTAAVCEATGVAVGITEIGVSGVAPEAAYQWETLVDREHRGHGLGYVLKAHNHWLVANESPKTRWINTWNAGSNTHMIAVNERLGFQPVECWTEWQLDL
jgi:GNAT superfamily N-acetyltransferase